MLQYIQDIYTLEQHIKRCPIPAILGIDTEFVRFNTYYPTLSVLQLNLDDLILVIDALMVNIAHTSCLRDLLQNPHIIKVLHGGQQDAAIFEQQGIVMQSVYDIHIAAIMAKFNTTSYKGLTKKLCAIELNKEQQMRDWLARPLPKQALEYAADDVRYLPALFRFFNMYINTEWVIQETQLQYYEPTDTMQPITALRYHLARKYNKPFKQIINTACIASLNQLINPSLETIIQILPKNLKEDAVTILQYLPFQQKICDHNLYKVLGVYIQQISNDLEYHTLFVCRPEWLMYLIRTNSLPTSIKDSWRYTLYGYKLLQFIKGRAILKYNDHRFDIQDI